MNSAVQFGSYRTDCRMQTLSHDSLFKVNKAGGRVRMCDLIWVQVAKLAERAGLSATRADLPGKARWLGLRRHVAKANTDFGILQ
jgi:hypothetical protein